LAIADNLLKGECGEGEKIKKLITIFGLRKGRD